MNQSTALTFLCAVFLVAGELYAQSVTISGDSSPLFSGSVSHWNAGSDADSNGFGDADLIIGDIGVGEMSVLDAAVTSRRGYIGNNTGSVGNATVSGASANWNLEFFLDVGRNGDGTLNVLNGASVSTPSGTYLGRWTAGTGDGTLVIQGAGSKLTSGSNLEVGGRGGSGRVEIEEGGVLISQSSGSLGSLAGSSGVVTIDGADSLWTHTGSVNIGDGGAGELSITNAGRGNLSSIRAGIAGGSAMITVEGSGAILSSTAVEVGSSGLAELEIKNGGRVETTNSLVIGRNSGSDGTVNISGANTNLSIGGSLIVGLESGSIGDLNLAGGAQSSSATDTAIGVRAGAAGEIRVVGVGTNMTVGEHLNIGSLGEGLVAVVDGASLSAVRDVRIALASGSSGQVDIAGGGTSWSSANLFIGGSRSNSGGSGTVTIREEAHASVAETVRIWGDGTLNLDGGTLDATSIDLESGSTFTMTDGMLVVDSFTGTLAQDGGVLAPGDSPGLTTIDGDYSLNAGSVWIELEGLSPGTEYDALNISGDAVLNGTIDVDLVGFAPVVGHSFELFAANSITGNPIFDFSDAALSPGLAWNTSSFLSTGSISVAAVPEPTSFGLVGMSLLYLSRRKRRT